MHIPKQCLTHSCCDVCQFDWQSTAELSKRGSSALRRPETATVSNRWKVRILSAILATLRRSCAADWSDLDAVPPSSPRSYSAATRPAASRRGLRKHRWADDVHRGTNCYRNVRQAHVSGVHSDVVLQLSLWTDGIHIGQWVLYSGFHLQYERSSRCGCFSSARLRCFACFHN